MFEFDSERVSSFDATSLSAKLTQRSSDGWEVVAIVPAGSDIVAYLRRATGAAASSTTSAGATSPDIGSSAGSSVSGGDGWASAGGSSAGAAASGWGSSTSTQDSSPARSDTAGSSAATAAAAAPADWYADPSGRHEQRYWDGSAWTHHVADRGQVSSDPPVD